MTEHAPALPNHFSDLNLHPALMTALTQMQWDACTPIQAQAIPKTMRGEDVAGKAQTGTGKTGAFLISLLHYLMTTPVKPDSTGPYAMILAPTRELANQIYDNCLELSAYTGLEPVAVYGGKEYDEQKSAFIHRQPDIIIGTPGRIIDLFKQRLFSLKQIEVLVLDEADRMFDLGFISDIRYLIKQMPEATKRMNLIFSATYSYRVQELAYEYLNGPELIEIESETETADDIEQVLYHCSKEEKPETLAKLLTQLHCEKSIVFVNMKVTLERLLEKLQKQGIACVGLSGDIPQHKREKMLKQFQDGEKTVLLATDVAARGLHIDDISHVFNYDLPQHPEDYIHRIGRTGRAGKSGYAISLACDEYVYYLMDIEEKLGEKIPVGSLDDVLKAKAEPAQVGEQAESKNVEEKVTEAKVDVAETDTEALKAGDLESNQMVAEVAEGSEKIADTASEPSEQTEQQAEEPEQHQDNQKTAKTTRKTNYPPRARKTSQDKSRNRGLYRRRTPTKRSKPSENNHSEE